MIWLIIGIFSVKIDINYEKEARVLVVDEDIHQSNNNIAVGVALPPCITPPVPSQFEEEEQQVEYLTELETREQDEKEEV